MRFVDGPQLQTEVYRMGSPRCRRSYPVKSKILILGVIVWEYWGFVRKNIDYVRSRSVVICVASMFQPQCGTVDVCAKSDEIITKSFNAD